MTVEPTHVAVRHSVVGAAPGGRSADVLVPLRVAGTPEVTPPDANRLVEELAELLNDIKAPCYPEKPQLLKR